VTCSGHILGLYAMKMIDFLFRAHFVTILNPISRFNP
jgi:hypothetical protein